MFRQFNSLFGIRCAYVDDDGYAAGNFVNNGLSDKLSLTGRHQWALSSRTADEEAVHTLLHLETGESTQVLQIHLSFPVKRREKGRKDSLKTGTFHLEASTSLIRSLFKSLQPTR
jgi:hypothetical protein